MNGSVAIVGAGPGDPALLTLGALRAIREADVVLYDALVSDAVIGFAPASSERLYVGKRGGDHSMAQHVIEALMIRMAREGKRVVRLKGGDPFVFGRGAEEAEALRAAEIPFQVLPGVTSATAVPAYAGIPLTHRALSSSFVVATGHEDPVKQGSAIDWAALARSNATLVFVMGVERLQQIAQQLVAHGLDPTTPAAVIADGTRPSQHCVVGTIASIPEDVERARILPPAVLVVGAVVRLRERLRWYDRAPLFGKRVLVTRPLREGSQSVSAFLASGMEPIIAPTVEIAPPDDPAPALRALGEINGYVWVVFLSRNGVDAFFEGLRAQGRDARALGSTKVAAIGAKTAEQLGQYGVRADLVSGRATGEDVVRALLGCTREGDRVLIYAAQEGRDIVRAVLAESGRLPVAVAAYKTCVVSDPHFAEKVASADILTFTSGSTVRAFAQLLGGDAAACEAARGKVVACIGPITANEARAIGLHVDVVPESFSMEALIAALETYASAPA